MDILLAVQMATKVCIILRFTIFPPLFFCSLCVNVDVCSFLLELNAHASKASVFVCPRIGYVNVENHKNRTWRTLSHTHKRDGLIVFNAKVLLSVIQTRKEWSRSKTMHILISCSVGLQFITLSFRWLRRKWNLDGEFLWESNNSLATAKISPIWLMNSHTRPALFFGTSKHTPTQKPHRIMWLCAIEDVRKKFNYIINYRWLCEIMSRKKERKNENYRVRMNSAAIRYLLPAFVWAFLSLKITFISPIYGVFHAHSLALSHFRPWKFYDFISISIVLFHSPSHTVYNMIFIINQNIFSW